MQSTFNRKDVTIMLQDLTGRLEPIDTVEREKLIQSGTHYSEMLPKEYIPTQEYMSLFEQSLKDLSKEVAYTVKVLGDKIVKRKGRHITIVSLARAGTPVGILLKHYIEQVYNIQVPHYTVSIIRDKGIDETAITTIASLHGSDSIQFIDGWVGKGKINTELQTAVRKLQRFNCCKNINSELGVLTDPANITELYGTRTDILIPSACLNATVTGLISRTIYTSDGLHGAVYFGDMKEFDRTYDFIEEVEKHFKDTNLYIKELSDSSNAKDTIKGINEVEELMREFNIKDINKIKPGIGETTRVLLRRVPDFIIIDKTRLQEKYYKHIQQLCREKNIDIIYRPLKLYGVIGVIKELADI